MSGGEFLDDLERAQARYMLGLAAAVRQASADRLREAFDAELRALADIETRAKELSDAGWDGLGENVRRFISDTVRGQLSAGGVNVWPVNAAYGDPVLCGG